MRRILLLAVIFGLLAVTVFASSCGTTTGAGEASSIEHFVSCPLVRQSTGYTCGVASLMSVLRFYGLQAREDTLAEKLGTTEDLGTDYHNIIAKAKAEGLSAVLQKDMSLEALQARMDKGQPVMCCIQAWGEPSDYAKDDNGHWVVAVGYDSNNFYFMDPSTLGNYTFIPRGEFAGRWHDSTTTEKLNRAGIVFDGKQNYNPDQVLKLG